MSNIIFVTSMGKKIQCADAIWEDEKFSGECTVRYKENGEHFEIKLKDYIFRQIGDMGMIFSK